MTAHLFGQTAGGGQMYVDVERLAETRALIQGTSGSGKSWLIRALIERAAARLPVIVLDMEGEFGTLRSKFDFLLAGERGEVSVDVRSAGLLARKLLQLRLSAVVDLFELTAPQRRGYVRTFLEGLMAAPRADWGPRLVVIDEAHAFAPESSQSESLGAVVDLASRGRKRGYGLIASTQRLSKLNKDVAAELRNVFVGQTTLDVDVRRAVDVLGFAADRESRSRLRGIEHEFYAFGPALSWRDRESDEGVACFRALAPETSQEPRRSRQAEPPRPSKAIASVLSELADLPAQASAEAATVADLQREVRQLRRQLKSTTPVIDAQAVERAADRGAADRDRHWQAEVARLRKQQAGFERRLAKIAELAGTPPAASPSLAPPLAARATPAAPRPRRRESTEVVAAADGEPLRMTAAQQRILDAIAWYESIGNDAPTLTQIGAVAMIDPTGGYFSNTVGPLSTAGLVERGGGVLRLTEAGRAAAQPIDGADTLDDYHDLLRQRVRKMRSASNKTIQILDAIIAAQGEPLTVQQIGEAVQVDPTGGYFSNSIGPLSTAGLIVRRAGLVTPTDVLFPPGFLG